MGRRSAEMRGYLKEANEGAKMKPLKPSEGKKTAAAVSGGYMIRK